MILNYTDASKYIRDIIHSTFSDAPKLIAVAMHPLEEQDFHRYPASSTWYHEGVLTRGHHCYFGGLLIHTAQVLELAVAAAAPLGDPDILKVLVMATIWHDWAKLWDYDPDIDLEERSIGEVRKAPHSRQHHHVYRSAAEFERHAGVLPPKFVFDVVHCILSHHGRPEWGSVIAPQSQAAFILHASDNLSAKFYGKNYEIIPTIKQQ